MGFDRCGEFSFGSGIMIYRLSGLAPGKQRSHPLPIFLFVLPFLDGSNTECIKYAGGIPPSSDIWYYKEGRRRLDECKAFQINWDIDENMRDLF